MQFVHYIEAIHIRGNRIWENFSLGQKAVLYPVSSVHVKRKREPLLTRALSCSIANVSISTLIEDRSEGATFGGTTPPVEECSCPAGYRGLSCQQWFVKLHNVCLTIVSSCEMMGKQFKLSILKSERRFQLKWMCRTLGRERALYGVQC